MFVEKTYPTRPYHKHRMDNIKSSLEHSGSDQPRFYEILIDDTPIVHKTSNLKEFDRYLNGIKDISEKLEVLLYPSDKSRRPSARHTFTLNGPTDGKTHEAVPVHPASSNSQTLNGAEIKQHVEEQLNRAQERWENNLLKRDFEKLKKDLEDSEGYAALLEKEVESLKSKGFSIGDLTLKDFGQFLGGIIKSNPQVLTKIPGGTALAGLFMDDSEKAAAFQKPQADSDVSFSKGPAISEEDQQYLLIFRALEQTLNLEQKTKVMGLLTKFCEDPKKIDDAAELFLK